MADVDLYPAEPRIHGPDVCKDAVEATPRINVVVSNPPITLFEKSMRVFGFKTCASYKTALDTLKKGIITSIGAHVIQLPINRLKRKYPYPVTDIASKTLPSNIKVAFYDSGPSPDSYKDDIQQYNTLASFTDPGPSSYIPANTSYPNIGTTVIFPDDTFDKMFPNSSILIKDFNGIINADKATLSFNIYQRTEPHIPTHRIIVDFVNSNNTDGSYNIRINDLVHPDLKCFHGNPTKNTFFNTNSIKGGEQDKILYGVLYIFCKEFCGDILIGLIAKHYDNLRKENPALPDYALVTGDGTLEAYACFLQVNHVAKNHSRAGLEEAIARIFAPPTDEQLQAIAIEEKGKVLDKIIEWNTLIYNACKYVSKNEVDIANIEPVTPPIRKIFDDFSKYIKNINTYLDNVIVGLEGNQESVSDFMKKYKSYEVKNVFKSVTADKAILMRGIYDPFKYVPAVPPIDRAGFPDIRGEFLNYLVSIKGNKSGGGRLEEDLLIGDTSFKPLEANTDEYLNTYLRDPESLINKDPTAFLKNIIRSILGRIPVDPNILEDVYNFIFPIYDKECKISYNEYVIHQLILFMYKRCETNIYEDEFDFYNTLLGTASATYTHPPEHNIPMLNAPAGMEANEPAHVEAEPWPFPPLAPVETPPPPQHGLPLGAEEGMEQALNYQGEIMREPNTQLPPIVRHATQTRGKFKYTLTLPQNKYHNPITRKLYEYIKHSKKNLGRALEGFLKQQGYSGEAMRAVRKSGYPHRLRIGAHGGRQTKKKIKSKNHRFTRKIQRNKSIRIKRRRTHKK